MHFSIRSISKDTIPLIREKIDNKAKPIGSLGILEELAIKICLIQNTFNPVLTKPVIVIFAGDHGIAEEGICTYPQKVTYQMVYNFLRGGAAINVFARQHNLDVKIIDAGVNHKFIHHSKLTDAKIRSGSKNFLYGPAMKYQECMMAVELAANMIDDYHKEGANIIGFGAMGIGNTSSAALIMHHITKLPLIDCIGMEDGFDQENLDKKLEILSRAIEANLIINDDPVTILSTFGGYETAMLVGGMLKAAELGMIILIDGFVTTSALLLAVLIYPDVLDYCIFSNVSDEKGHRAVLDYLEVKPLLHLKMSLEEGSGTALAYPLVQSAVNFMNEMASFEDAKISRSQ